jgi:raffinose/stachyose/melibiose transport system substrate-binding protein
MQLTRAMNEYVMDLTRRANMKKLIVLLSVFLLVFSTVVSAETVLRINTWDNPATNKALEEINQRFMKQNPDIKVEFTFAPRDQFNQENPMRVSAGDVDIWADFGFSNHIQDYHKGAALPLRYQNIEAGLVEPLDGQAFLKNYKAEAVKDAMTYKGKVYGVCVGSVAFSGIFYNKDLFAKYNLQVPTTYEELVMVAETLKQNGVTPFTTAGAAVWPVNMSLFGFLGPLIQDNEAFEKELWMDGPGYKNPKYMEALEKYQNLLLNYYEDGFQALEYNPHIGRFTSGAVAMLPDGMWQANSIAAAKDLNFKFGYMPIPASDNAADNKTFFGKYDLLWMVHAKSKNKAAALKWLEFFSQKDTYQYFINTVGFLPTQPDVTVENPVLAEITQYPLKPSFEQVHVARQNQGRYADGSIVHLKPVGTIETVTEFVDLAQKDWQAAAAK